MKLYWVIMSQLSLQLQQPGGKLVLCHMSHWHQPLKKNINLILILIHASTVKINSCPKAIHATITGLTILLISTQEQITMGSIDK